MTNESANSYSFFIEDFILISSIEMKVKFSQQQEVVDMTMVLETIYNHRSYPLWRMPVVSDFQMTVAFRGVVSHIVRNLPRTWETESNGLVILNELRDSAHGVVPSDVITIVTEEILADRSIRYYFGCCGTREEDIVLGLFCEDAEILSITRVRPWDSG